MKRGNPAGASPKQRRGQKTVGAETLAEQRHRVAAVCGLLAGMPDACRKASEAVEDMRRRASLAALSVEQGIVDNTQADLLSAVAAQAEEMLGLIASCRDIADVMARGAVKPEGEEISLV